MKRKKISKKDEVAEEEVKPKRRRKMPKKEECDCGGGQSCLVDRRKCRDWIHEDTILKDAGVQVRKNCMSEPTKEQKKVLDDFEKEMNEGHYDSIIHRWSQ